MEPDSQVVTRMTETAPTYEADSDTTLRRAQSASAKQMPLISVIMPVRNERKTLPALLNALVSQEYPKDLFEILVADGRSDDGTREYVVGYGLSSPVVVRLVDNPAIRSGPGRNAGISQARGEFIVFVDGHCHIPSLSLLLDTVRLFDESRADCLCRPQPLSAPTGKPMGRVIANVRASSLGHGRDSLIYDMQYSGFVDPASSGASYRRHVFEAIGRYDESFDACEDVEFNTRVREAGMTAYTDPALAVYYEPRSSLKALFLQMSRYGRGRVRLARKIGRHLYHPIRTNDSASMARAFGGFNTSFSSLSHMASGGRLSAGVALSHRHRGRLRQTRPTLWACLSAPGTVGLSCDPPGTGLRHVG